MANLSQLACLPLAELRQRANEIRELLHVHDAGGLSLIRHAIRNDRFDNAFFFITQGADINEVAPSTENSLMHELACKTGLAGKSGAMALQLFLELLSRGGTDIRSLRNASGETCVETALAVGNKDMARACFDFVSRGTQAPRKVSSLSSSVQHIHGIGGASGEEISYVQQTAFSSLSLDGSWEPFRRDMFGRRVFVYRSGHCDSEDPALAVVVPLANESGRCRCLFARASSGRLETLFLDRDQCALYGEGDEQELMRRVLQLNGSMAGMQWMACTSPSMTSGASILEMEARLGVSTRIAVGIIWGHSGQVSEEEMLKNREPSEALAKFLSFLGDEVQEDGGYWGWTGGVPVKERPIVACWRGFEFVFHVAPFLSEDQQRQRIGNDSVLLYFVEGATLPQGKFRGQVNAVAVVVNDLGGETAKLSLFYRKSLTSFKPYVTRAELQKGSKLLRDRIFVNIINAQYHVAHSDMYSKLNSARFRFVLSEILKVEPVTAQGPSPRGSGLAKVTPFRQGWLLVNIPLKIKGGPKKRWCELYAEGLNFFDREDGERLGVVEYVGLAGGIDLVQREGKLVRLMDAGRVELSGISSSGSELRSWRASLSAHRPEGAVIIEGYIYKRKEKGKGKHSGQKKRWCIANDITFRYLDKPNGVELGSMLIQEMQVAMLHDELLVKINDASYVFSSVQDSPPVSVWMEHVKTTQSTLMGMAGKLAKLAGTGAQHRASTWPEIDGSKSEVPAFLTAAFDELEERGLNEVGIFRLTGDLAAMDVLSGLWKAGRKGTLQSEDVHVIACCVKKYLRDIMNPVFTFDVYDSMLEAGRETDMIKKMQRIGDCVQRLPEGNRHMLCALITFLDKVQTRSELNKMGPQNLAIVFAPALVRTKNNDPLEALTHMDSLTSAVCFLIQHFQCCRFLRCLDGGLPDWSHNSSESFASPATSPGREESKSSTTEPALPPLPTLPPPQHMRNSLTVPTSGVVVKKRYSPRARSSNDDSPSSSAPPAAVPSSEDSDTTITTPPPLVTKASFSRVSGTLQLPPSPVEPPLSRASASVPRVTTPELPDVDPTKLSRSSGPLGPGAKRVLPPIVPKK